MPGSRRTDPAQLRLLTAARVLELTPDIAVVTDYEGTILFANAALERRLGVPIDELLGAARRRLPAPRGPRRRGPAWQELLAGERDGLELALRFGSADTGWRWCLGSIGIDREPASPSAPTRRPPPCATPRSASSAPSRTPRIGMAITGIDGRFVRVNRSLAAMLGREPQQLAGVPVRDITHPAAPRRRPRGDARARGRRARTPTAPRSATCAPTAARRGSRSHVTVVRNADGGPPVLPLADGRHRRAPRRRAGAGPERGALPLAGRRPRPSASSRSPRTGRLAYANERLREIFDVLGRRVLDGTPLAGARLRPRTASAWSASSAARGRWATRLALDVRIVRRHRRAGRASHVAPVSKGARRADGPRRDDRGRHRGGRRRACAGRARGRVPDARRALDGLPVAPRARRHLPLRVAGVAAPCSATTPSDARSDAQARSSVTIADDMRSSSALGRGAARRSARAPSPTALRRRDGSIVLAGDDLPRRPRRRRRGAEMVCVVARHLRAQERRARARPPRAARRAHRPAQPHAVPRPPRPGAAPLRAGAARGVAVAVPRPRPLQGRQRLARPRGRRPAAGRRRQRLSAAAAPGRHGRALRRRRVHGAVRGRRRRRATRRAIAQRLARRVRASRSRSQDGEVVPAGEHRHRALARRLETPEDLLRDADAAMYRAKERGQGRSRSSTRPCASDVRDRARDSRAELRRALERGELRLHYQPIVDARRRRASRASRRWCAGSTPSAACCRPATFIPLAEETGLIVRIGAWVLQRGVRRRCGGHRRDRDDEPAGLGQPLGAPAPAARPRRAGARARSTTTASSPSCLVLEITESAIMEAGADGRSCARSRTSACAWRSTTSAPATRRWPTCTASRSTAQDRPLVRRRRSGDGQGASIAAAIVSLAHALGLRTVAEGIEDRRAAPRCSTSAATSGRATSSRGRCRSRN